MKSVLISTRPKLVEKICHKIGEDETGKAIYEKRIEVRKTAPKEVPFKCYIYETKGQYVKFTHGAHTKYGYGRGKVIGEFICDRIICSQAYFDSQGKNHLTNVFPDDIKKTCLDEYDLWDYIAGKAVKANQMYDGYLWHISDLKIYDKPRELSEFRKPCDRFLDCCTCRRLVHNEYMSCDNKITRPPLSWCYVEDLGEEE
jgi:hypothetical protein